MGSWFVLGPEPHLLVSKISQVLRPHLLVGAWQRSIIGWFWSWWEIRVWTCKRLFALLVHWGRSLRASTSQSLCFVRRCEIRPRWRRLLTSLNTSFVVPRESCHAGIWFRGFTLQDFRLDKLHSVDAVDYLLNLFLQMGGFASDFRQMIEIGQKIIALILVYFILIPAFNC